MTGAKHDEAALSVFPLHRYSKVTAEKPVQSGVSTPSL
jgi:hypothetical protein